MVDSRFRILMVDDVRRYQQMYETTITDAFPATVHFAANGKEALEKLDDPDPYDLLILDLNMPELNGEETLRHVRQDPSFDSTPVIILTGSPDPKSHRQLLELGADDFMEKGLPPELFVSRLRAQLRYKLALDRLARMAVDMDIFAAGVLHDIRNIEMNIVTVCELTRMGMKKSPETFHEQSLKDFRNLEDRAAGLGKYATDVIEMVRETHKKLTLNAQDLRSLFEWVCRIARPEGQEDAISHEYRGTIHKVVADQNFLQLALLNIVQNAVKYAREDVPTHLCVTQTITTGTAAGFEGRRAITCIRDNGIGIAEDDLRSVFKPFVRGKSRTKTRGFGLGLSLVAKVMHMMEGRVWAEKPKEGFGTVICLDLPTDASPTGDADR